MQWLWWQWSLQKKAEAAMVVAIIHCAAQWQQSMVAAVMAVAIAGGSGHCQWRQWRSLLMGMARADAGKGRQGHEGEGFPVARCHPAAIARARADKSKGNGKGDSNSKKDGKGEGKGNGAQAAAAVKHCCCCCCYSAAAALLLSYRLPILLPVLLLYVGRSSGRMVS
jgi:hypothetical protein